MNSRSNSSLRKVCVLGSADYPAGLHQAGGTRFTLGLARHYHTSVGRLRR
jgi:hypothetical protein